MEDTIQILILAIKKLAAIFRSYEVNHWAAWLEEDASLLEIGDLEGIDHLMSAYGGMGSITDVFITPHAGYAIEESDISRVNNQIITMLSEIYEMAAELKRGLSRDGHDAS